MISRLLEQSLLFGQSAVSAPSGTNSLSWFVVIFCVVVGVVVALNHTRRTSEIKRTKD